MILNFIIRNFLLIILNNINFKINKYFLLILIINFHLIIILFISFINKLFQNNIFSIHFLNIISINQILFNIFINDNEMIDNKYHHNY